MTEKRLGFLAIISNFLAFLLVLSIHMDWINAIFYSASTCFLGYVLCVTLLLITRLVNLFVMEKKVTK